MARLAVGGLWLAFLFGCEAPPKAPERGPIELEAFVVSAPPGQGWSVAVDPERQEVSFLNRDEWGFVQIRVLPTRPAWLHEPYGQAQTAAEFFSYLENLLLQKERQERGYRLGYVNRNVAKIGGKTLYGMTFWELQEAGPYGFESWASQSAVYLYFPPDFPAGRILYQFRITESHAVGALRPASNLRGIRPVIESFRLNQAPKGPEDVTPRRPEVEP